VIKELVPITR